MKLETATVALLIALEDTGHDYVAHHIDEKRGAAMLAHLDNAGTLHTDLVLAQEAPEYAEDVATAKHSVMIAAFYAALVINRNALIRRPWQSNIACVSGNPRDVRITYYTNPYND